MKKRPSLLFSTLDLVFQENPLVTAPPEKSAQAHVAVPLISWALAGAKWAVWRVRMRHTAHGELGCDSAILFATCAVLRRRAKKRKLVALLASTEHPGERERKTIHARVPRTPVVWSERMRLSDGAFRRRYRMPKETFTSLCGTLAGPMAEMHGMLGHRIPHGVSVEVQVSVSIRWLAGGSYLDVADVHGVSDTTLYQSLRAFLFALVHHPR